MRKIVFITLFALLLSITTVVIASAQNYGTITDNPFYKFETKNLSKEYNDFAFYVRSEVPNPPAIPEHPAMTANWETYGGDYKDPYSRMQGTFVESSYYNRVGVYASINCLASGTHYFDEDSGHGNDITTFANINLPFYKNANNNLHIGKVYHGFLPEEFYYAAYPMMRYED